MIKALFAESNWKMKLTKRGSRVEIGLYWGDKEIPTHTTAIDVEDLINLVEDRGFTFIKDRL